MTPVFSTNLSLSCGEIKTVYYTSISAEFIYRSQLFDISSCMKASDL